MATAEVMLPSEPMSHKFEPLVRKELSTIAESLNTYSTFDPQRHLNFSPPSKVYSMGDLDLPEDTGVSQVAVSEPFPLFTEETIYRMRAEVLSDAVWDNCQYSSNLAQCQLRGFAAQYAPFVYDAWKNPETLAIISKIAGVDLVTAMDFEIGHINISVKSKQQKSEEHFAVVKRKTAETEEGNAECSREDDKPIVDWHTDSYPFVCVTMLSDCTSMIGGETALKTGNGKILKVRGPQMGCAVVLQGRYIEHQALRAVGAMERITMVTSFRPRSPSLPDDTVLTTVRAVSNLQELYFQFSEYRLEILEERIREQLKNMRETKRGRKHLDTKILKRFLKEQEDFLLHMNDELVLDEHVTAGRIDDSHILRDGNKTRSKKRTRLV